MVYLRVDLDVRLARIAHREAATPHETFPMSVDDVRAWRGQFQVPTPDDLAGGRIPRTPTRWPTWLEWAVDWWPTLDPSAD